ncbi:MAG: glycoside hydrolase family 38 C-terminal domain-containing protein, partial [Planctomycetia bacterium]|nr:glycoside hydrolase family 38 C-terminal domain-containing protein [Planctomycetia bacterium]
SRGENARSAERKAIGIASEITLRAGSRRLEFKTTVDNTCRDHRLRVRFPSDIEASDSFADGQFDVVKRPIKVPDRTGWKEPAPAEHPQQAFVDVTDGAVGLAVLNDGIPEYEVTDDARRTIALTLLRCVGPSIGDDETEDEAQLPGRHEFRYALYPHAGNYEDADVPHEALDFRVPLKICLSRRHEGTMPMSMSMFSVSPKSLVVTGTKKCEDRKSVIVRLYNSSTKAAAGRLRWHKPLKGCYNLDLLEKRKEKIATRGRGASFRAGPKQIITLEVLS